MENSSNKPNYILMAITLVIFLLGLGLGILIGINIDGTPVAKIEDGQEVSINAVDEESSNNTVGVNETKTVAKKKEYKPETSKEDRLKTALSQTMVEAEADTLKETVKKDEEEYGEDYHKLTGYNYFKRDPDRIYFKSPKVEGFYKFEKDDEDYAHLFEVSEDRMSYSVVEDFNLYCFTPDSIEKMMSSGDNYIIFDYDNGDLPEYDPNYQQDLIFRFNANTRLFRLATSLSYDKELTLYEDLGKKEFARDTTLSGYKYIMSTIDNGV